MVPPAEKDDANLDGSDDRADHLERSSIARNVAQLFASQVVTWAMSFAVGIVVPRFLGPSNVGDLRLAMSLWAISGIFIGLGTGVYLTLAIADDRTRGLALVGPILVVRTIAFAATTVLFGIVILASNPSTELIVIMALNGLSVLFGTWSEPIGAAFLGLERTAAPALAGVISRAVGAVVTITVVVFGGGAASVVAVSALSSALGLVLVARALLKVTTIRFRGWRPQSRAIVRSSVAFMVSGVLITVYREIDTVFMSALVDREVLGWYGTADQLIGSSLFIITIVMTSIFPVLGRLHKDDPPRFFDLVKRSYGSLMVAAVPIGLGIIVVAPQLVPMLYGGEFEPTAQVLAVYGLVVPLTFGAILFGTVATATGRQRFWNGLMFLGIVATLPLDLLLIPWADRTYSNGAIGGAISYLVTEGLMFVVGMVKICPYLINRATMLRSGRILVAGAVMFAAAWPLHDRILVVPVGVGIVVYAIAIAALRVMTDDERAMVGRALERLGIHTSWGELKFAGFDDSEIA